MMKRFIISAGLAIAFSAKAEQEVNPQGWISSAAPPEMMQRYCTGFAPHNVIYFKNSAPGRPKFLQCSYETITEYMPQKACDILSKAITLNRDYAANAIDVMDGESIDSRIEQYYEAWKHHCGNNVTGIERAPKVESL